MKVGDTHSLVVADGLTRAQIAQYAGASGDFHPFHTDEAHAIDHGFDSVFAHGMHTMGLSGRVISDLVGDAAIKNYRAELRRQVWPGDTLTATAEVTRVESDLDHPVAHLSIHTTDQNGEVVLTGTATVWIGTP